MTYLKMRHFFNTKDSVLIELHEKQAIGNTIETLSTGSLIRHQITNILIELGSRYIQGGYALGNKKCLVLGKKVI